MSAFTYSRLSPLGRGAILVVEVSGPGGRDAVGQCLKNWSGDHTRVHHGELCDLSGEVIDDVVVVPIEGDGVLVTFHGNPVLVERFLEVLAELGGRSTAGVWPFGSEDAGVARECIELLPRAFTAEAATFLLSQRSGGLTAWRDKILSTERCPTLDEVDGILARCRQGRGLFEPRRVVIAGVPNAGKSTLFNHFLGHRRVVTHETAGTTRDLIEELVPIGAYPIRLNDGAGLRRSGAASQSPIEEEGILRIGRALESCDLAILLTPPVAVASAADSDRVRAEVTARAPLCLEVRSRSDEGGNDEGGNDEGGNGEEGSGEGENAIGESVEGHDGSALSVHGGTGVAELERRVLTGLFGSAEPPGGEPTPFLQRQEQVLAQLRRALIAGEPVLPVVSLL